MSVFETQKTFEIIFLGSPLFLGCDPVWFRPLTWVLAPVLSSPETPPPLCLGVYAASPPSASSRLQNTLQLYFCVEGDRPEALLRWGPTSHCSRPAVLPRRVIGGSRPPDAYKSRRREPDDVGRSAHTFCIVSWHHGEVLRTQCRWTAG